MNTAADAVRGTTSAINDNSPDAFDSSFVSRASESLAMCSQTLSMSTSIVPAGCDNVSGVTTAGTASKDPRACRIKWNSIFVLRVRSLLRSPIEMGCRAGGIRAYFGGPFTRVAAPALPGLEDDAVLAGAEVLGIVIEQIYQLITH